MPDTTRPAPPCLRILALKGYAEQVPSGSAVHENSGAGEGFAVRVPSLVASRFAARVRLADLHGTVAPSSKDHVGVAAGELYIALLRSVHSGKTRAAWHPERIDQERIN